MEDLSGDHAEQNGDIMRRKTKDEKDLQQSAFQTDHQTLLFCVSLRTRATLLQVPTVLQNREIRYEESYKFSA